MPLSLWQHLFREATLATTLDEYENLRSHDGPPACGDPDRAVNVRVSVPRTPARDALSTHQGRRACSRERAPIARSLGRLCEATGEDKPTHPSALSPEFGPPCAGHFAPLPATGVAYAPGCTSRNCVSVLCAVLSGSVCAFLPVCVPGVGPLTRPVVPRPRSRPASPPPSWCPSLLSAAPDSNPEPAGWRVAGKTSVPLMSSCSVASLKHATDVEKVIRVAQPKRRTQCRGVVQKVLPDARVTGLTL